MSAAGVTLDVYYQAVFTFRTLLLLLSRFIFPGTEKISQMLCRAEPAYCNMENEI